MPYLYTFFFFTISRSFHSSSLIQVSIWHVFCLYEEFSFSMIFCGGLLSTHSLSALVNINYLLHLYFGSLFLLDMEFFLDSLFFFFKNFKTSISPTWCPLFLIRDQPPFLSLLWTVFPLLLLRFSFHTWLATVTLWSYLYLCCLNFAEFLGHELLAVTSFPVPFSFSSSGIPIIHIFYYLLLPQSILTLLIFLIF